MKNYVKSFSGFGKQKIQIGLIHPLPVESARICFFTEAQIHAGSDYRGCLDCMFVIQLHYKPIICPISNFVNRKNEFV
ncbi:MAG: hypothetical protein JEY91_07170 [Spirochaetaceae bacterium]|nr:hypothetical protein [Spirochaetaceae bacterium]